MSEERLTLRSQRHIVKRIVIRGTLTLDTPTCLGSGDAEGLVDLMLLRDSFEENKALLTGASIAGALRSYLREYHEGYTADDNSILFGACKGDSEGDQSFLIINDALSKEPVSVELRDGVKINSARRTAEDKAKYDLEFLQAGTQFDLYFELLIGRRDDTDRLIAELVTTLRGLEQGEISIGMKKQRGFGRCHVNEWQVWQFNMQDAKDRLAWLTLDRTWTTQVKQPDVGKIFDILKPQRVKLDQRDRLIINAKFKLDGSLLIRAAQAETGRVPDVVHLKSKRNSEFQNVLSGTSLAGVLRHRAERILNTLGKDLTLLEELFGFVNEKSKKSQSSRLVIYETEIKKGADLVQSRIPIDRFTGGAMHGTLFDEQPVFGGEDTVIKIDLELRQPKNAEIGLLLLLLKDLWTSDLPLGGESSIGRGRLQGKEAKITHSTIEQNQEWTIIQEDQCLNISDAQALEKFVQEFVNYKIEKDIV